MKRRAIAIGLIICMLLPFSVLLVFAKEPDVYFYDCFNQYPTNAHALDGYTISNSQAAVISEEEAGNKILLLKNGLTSIKYDFENAVKDEFTASFTVYEKSGGIDLDFGMTNGDKSISFIKINGNMLETLEGQQITHEYTPGGKTVYAFSTNNKTGRTSFYINGECVLKNIEQSNKTDAYKGWYLSKNGCESELGIDDISFCSGTKVYTAESMRSFNTQGSAVYNTQKLTDLYIDQDPSDYTYFHSKHIVNAPTSYLNTKFYDKGVNKYTVEPFDYKNPDKGDRIILTRYSTSDVYFDTDIRNRAEFLPSGYKYSYYVLDGYIAIDNKTVGGEVMMLRDDTSGTSQDFMINMTEGRIISHDGKALSEQLILNKEYHLQVYFDFETHTYDVYIDGELVGDNLTIPSTVTKLCKFRARVYKGSGSMILRNWEFTGLVKKPVRSKDANGKPYTTVEHCSQFPDDSVVEEYLNDKIVFHGDAKCYYTNGEKKSFTTEPVYKDNELYVSLEDFNAAMGKDNSLSKTPSGGSDIKCNPISVNGNQLYPVSDLAGKIGFYTKNSGYGSMVIVSRNDDLIETSDNDMPWFDNQFASTGSNFPIMNFTDAQEISNYIFFDRPKAERLKEDFNAATDNGQAHPRLMLTSDKVDEIRERRKTDEYFESLCQQAIKSGDGAVDGKSVTYTFSDNMRLFGAGDSFSSKMIKLSTAYILTGERKYAEQAIKNMLEVADFPDINPAHIIDVGVWLRGYAIGYDWCYSAMTDEEREKISNAILNLGVKVMQKPYYALLPSGGSTGFQLASWYPRWKSNYTAYVQGGIVPACLAVAEKDDVCFDVLEKSFRSWEYMLMGLYPQGAWQEGKDYQRVVNEYMAYACGSLLTACNNEYGVLRYPGVADSVKGMMSMSSFTGDFMFADDQRDANTPMYEVRGYFQFYSNYTGDKSLSAWRQLLLDTKYHTQYAPNMRKDTAGDLDIIYYTGEADMDSIKEKSKIDVMEGTERFVLHQDWLDENGTYFAAAGGPTRHYHMHNDGGDFIWMANGERWNLELGRGNYNLSNIWNRYSGRTEAHNTLTINPDAGFSQDEHSFAPLESWAEGSGGAYAVYDMTQLYAWHGASKIKRGFYIGDNYKSLTVRDEMSFDKKVTGYWFMNTDAELVQLGDDKILMSKNGKSMIFSYAAECKDAKAELKIMPCEPLPTSPKLSGDNQYDNVKKIAIYFEGKGDINITAKMSPTNESIDTTPIADWKAPEKTEGKTSTLSYKLYVNGSEMIDASSIPVPDKNNLPSFEIVPDSSTATSEIISGGGIDEPILMQITDNNESALYVLNYTTEGENLMNLSYKIHDISDFMVSATPEAQNSGENMFDKNLDTRWCGYYDGTYTILDLGESKRIDAVALAFWKGNGRNYRFDILTSNDGENWSDPKYFESNGETDNYEIFNLDTVNARYVKLISHENSQADTMNISEFRVLELR